MTGFVVDYNVMSKYCHMCAIRTTEFEADSPEFVEWKKVHVEIGECQINFEGSSGRMEIAAAEAMWKRSIEHCNMRYTRMLSDGDAKTHTYLQSLQVYGPDIDIRKEECANHIAKRMGNGLRNVVKEWRAKKMILGGKGEGTLKESTIDKLTTYYRL
ncbi:uncharacterized protein LOC143366414 [Andrena cerasifolii]|uniref:uncharacterized protein LOC143366414 n=1 Tax=Andrena cerasifolii TaxID=2819439 RepID=UPI004038094A